MLLPAKMFLLNAERVKIVIEALFFPFNIGIRRIRWRYEILHFHLLKFSLPEEKLPWRYLIAKRFPDLRDTKWNRIKARIKDVFIIDENTLRCLAAQIHFLVPLLKSAECGCGEKALRCNRAKIFCAACGTVESRPMFVKDGIYLLLRHLLISRNADNLQQMIRAKFGVAFVAHDQRVGKAGDVSACLPYLPGGKNARIKKSHVVTRSHGSRPRFDDMSAKFDTKRSPIVRSGEPAVYLGSGKYESTPFA